MESISVAAPTREELPGEAAGLIRVVVVETGASRQRCEALSRGGDSHSGGIVEV